MSRRIGLVMASMLLAACQAGGSTQATPTAAPAMPAATTAATASPPAATPTPPPNKPVTLPRISDVPLAGTCESEHLGCLGTLEKGKRYTTTTFKPTVSFVIPSAGWDNPNEAGGDLPIFSTTDVGDVIFFFSHARSTDPKVGYTVDAIATWLQGYDQITATPATPAAVGGLEGVRMDITIAPAATNKDPKCPVQVCVPLLRGDDPVANDPYQWHWDWGLEGTERQRLYLLDADGVVVAIFIDSLDGLTFDKITGAFDQMAPSIKITR